MSKEYRLLIDKLFRKYKAGTLSREERAEFDEYRKTDEGLQAAIDEHKSLTAILGKLDNSWIWRFILALGIAVYILGYLYSSLFTAPKTEGPYSELSEQINIGLENIQRMQRRPPITLQQVKDSLIARDLDTTSASILFFHLLASQRENQKLDFDIIYKIHSIQEGLYKNELGQFEEELNEKIRILLQLLEQNKTNQANEVIANMSLEERSIIKAQMEEINSLIEREAD